MMEELERTFSEVYIYSLGHGITYYCQHVFKHCGGMHDGGWEELNLQVLLSQPIYNVFLEFDNR